MARPGADISPPADAPPPVPLSLEAGQFLDTLVQLQLASPQDIDAFLAESATTTPAGFEDSATLGRDMVRAGLLTEYVVDRVRAGTTYGLVLGNYRVVDRLGGGSVSVVFLGEHVHMKRRAAIKVLPVDDDFEPSVLERFYSEMRILAELHHNNIITAFDAGALPAPAPGMPALHYLVTELVDGGDLEVQVAENGPAAITVGCDWIRQAACGLQAAHDRHLIHRDLKPSNMMLNRQGEVKLVDFGLARQFSSRLTVPKSLLGTIEFMAPEQARDASSVGGPADIYGLGASLFWIITGEMPYPPQKNIAQALRALQANPPRRLRAVLPSAPQELDDLIARMLERDPQRRPAMAVTVMNELTRFASRSGQSWDVLDIGTQVGARSTSQPAVGGPAATHVLIVSADEELCRQIRAALPASFACHDTPGTGDFETILVASAADIVLVDLDRTDVDPLALCTEVGDALRRPSARPHAKLITLSGRPPQEAAGALLATVDDHLGGCLDQPAQAFHLAARLRHAAQLRDAQVRADDMARQLLRVNRQQEESLASRDADLIRAQDALLFAMSRMAESGEGESASHVRRLQRYCRALIEALAAEPGHGEQATRQFIENIERAVSLHDIGKVALPDAVLSKPSALTAAERTLVETHTVIGSSILDAIAREFGASLPILAVASVVVRHHHERYDGHGYPDKLAGDTIPLPARVVAVADVYDALRRQLPHKPPLSHADSVRLITAESGRQFDPAVIRAFQRCQGDFERIFRDSSV